MKFLPYLLAFVGMASWADRFLSSQTAPFTPHNLLYMSLHDEPNPVLISLSAVQNDIEPFDVVLRDNKVHLWFRDEPLPSAIPFERFKSWYREASEVEYALSEVIYRTELFFTYLAKSPISSVTPLLSTLTDVLKEYKQNPPGYLSPDQNRVIGQVGYKLHPGVYSTVFEAHLSQLCNYADSFDSLKNLVMTSFSPEDSLETKKSLFDDWYWQETAKNAEQRIIDYIQNPLLVDVLRTRCRHLWIQLHVLRNGGLLDQRGFSVYHGRYFVGKGISRYGDYPASRWHTERVTDPFGTTVRCFWTSNQQYAAHLERGRH